MKFWLLLILTALMIRLGAEDFGLGHITAVRIACVFALAIIIARRMFLFATEGRLVKIAIGR